MPTSAHPPREVLDRLLARHGTTYAAEAGITLHDKPSPLFELVVLTHLLSANLAAELGIRAADAMRREYRTAAVMADASDEDRWRVLSDARYLRKERTAELLGRMARQVVDDWSGDLRRLRDDARGDADAIADAVADRIRDLPGIGAVGADIFTREVQAVWPDLRPRADQRVLDTARALGLPDTAKGLADLHGSTDLSVVGAALVRCELAGDQDDVRG